ncbi:DMT family transporter [cf. Phormidesmis sp. LEGE 11477]|uniref:DMT family transporter n=1 Tax=cf. Phormidesmis sp. LEGE 11477 TaxID=1828680 RepID=UPI0018826B6A|nr:DMT family transporter [cf. Phormidesmis sp. LEGE 11477]MBE9061513.1 DMT family transporter [cf. Phormidesmis sp. LEGE 11477]
MDAPQTKDAAQSPITETPSEEASVVTNEVAGEVASEVASEVADTDSVAKQPLRLPPILQPAAGLVTNPLVLVSPFFLWGTAMVAMKGVMTETSPLFLASMRLLPAGILVVLASVALGREQPKGWSAWLWIGLFALIDGTLFQGFLAKGLERTGAGLGSVMIDSQPLAVAIMARFLFKEWIGTLGWLGLSIGLLGISFIGLPDEWIFSLFQGQWFNVSIALEQEMWTVLFQQGEWLMLMAALSMAVGTILIGFVAKVADPVAATGWHMILGGMPLAITSALGEPTAWQSISLSGWLEIGYATVFGSAIAYGVFFYIAAQGNLTSLSALTFLTPVFALLFSTLLLAESLSFLQWSGVMLTLISIYLINQRVQLSAYLSEQLALPIDYPGSQNAER